MSKDRIEGRDIVGDVWSASKGDALTRAANDEGYASAEGCAVIVSIYEGRSPTTGFLDQHSAARLGAFLLEAASVDIVGAAREVMTMLDAASADNGAEYAEMVHALRGLPGLQRGLAALAAELAKLDALT